MIFVMRIFPVLNTGRKKTPLGDRACGMGGNPGQQKPCDVDVFEERLP
ncbi:hypothetical protein [Aureimonas altamirensis]|nr:hypothetical protein [Aureimonas altamirensis]